MPLFRRHSDSFAQNGVQNKGPADAHRVGAHLNGHCHLTKHVNCKGASRSAAWHLAMAMMRRLDV
jgi:hypothetical protein